MTVPVIKLDISKKKYPTQLYIYYFATEKLICKNQYPFQILGVVVQNGGTPTYSHRHAMAGLIRTSLTDREILSGFTIHLILYFGTYTESPGFKRNPNVVYATNIPKITSFSERLKERTLTKYNFVN